MTALMQFFVAVAMLAATAVWGIESTLIWMIQNGAMMPGGW